MSNPSPLVNSIAPTNITAGSAAATLTVNGSGFISTSVVEWNGSDRATIYVSATQIQATLTIADLALGGTAQVVVVNPSPGGGTSSAETFTIDNPIPQISSLSPNTVETSDANLQVKIMGSNFVSSSSVTWNGAIQTSSYVSSTEIQFTLSADDVRTAGGAQVSVINPGPGGGSAAPRMIRINGPVVVYPSTVSVPIGGTVDFSAYLPSQPSNTSFTWAVGGSDSGAVT
ncbi:MAG TPA: hypothetical protein VN661_08465, partial [Candidatus Acidoferrales bacterium]|nr:hypothetical protein [Candidatus Acidoferrales bacterium]